MLRKLELFCPTTVVSATNRPAVKDLPTEFFSCANDALDCQWRNIASAGFAGDQPIDAFWLQVEGFEDAGGNQCFKELALGVTRLPTLPLFKTFCTQNHQRSIIPYQCLLLDFLLKK